MNEELEKRWKPIDEYINKHYKEYTRINKETRDNIQDIFNEFNIDGIDLNKNITTERKARLNRKIKKILDKTPKDNYIYFKLNAMLKSKNITYRQLLDSLIEMVYAEERLKLDEYETILFQNVMETSYNTAISEIVKQTPPEKRKRISPFDMEIYYLLMNIPLLYGTSEAYLWALAETQAQELYKKILMDLQIKTKLDVSSENMKRFLLKQQNRYIKPESHSGIIENIIESYYNLAYIQAGLDNNIKQVRFIAKMDKKTTDMCTSLNNQIFYLDRMNVYDRYSDYDGKNVIYHTKGLVIGENLPPINNHFHWCRSTITYLLDSKSSEYVRNNIKVATVYDKEQFDRYKKVLEDDFYFNNVEEFVSMKENNLDEWQTLKEKYRYRNIASKKKETKK